MKTKLLSLVTAVILFLMPGIISAQAPGPGSAANYISFSSDGIEGIGSSDAVKTNEALSIYPNPFKTSLHVVINEATQSKKPQLKLYSLAGAEVLNSNLTKHLTTMGTDDLPSGIYFYKLIANNIILQSGKLVSRK